MPTPPPSISSIPAKPADARREPGTFATARYRVWQFWRSLAPRPLESDDRAIVERTLPPPGRALFAAMSLNDQRHSLTVHRALVERGCADGDMLAAALLHDCGKGGGRVRLWVRPPVVLLKAFAPGMLRWLTREAAPGRAVPRWRRPFYCAWRHPEIGADLAARAGLSERAVLLIRTHHLPDGPAAELHAVDDAL